jgi:omega-hydroxy-beta-dihydromenaquinone-9 sulfotransferase
LEKKELKFQAKHYFSFTSHAAFGSSLKAWIKILYKNNFALHPFFIPKAIFISIAIVMGIPFRWYEKMKYNKIILQQQIKNPVFIIGHPRSGTTFIHYLLSKDPQFAYCKTTQAILPHVFLSGAEILRTFISKALPALRPMDNLKMGTEHPKEEEFALVSYGPESMISGFYFPKNYTKIFKEEVLFKSNETAERNWKKHFDYFLKKLSYANNGKRLLLKSPANTGRIKQILALYPDAKFIHIHRNPYEVYSSTIHLFQKMLPMLSFQKIKKEAVKHSVFECYSELYKKYLDEFKLIPSGNLIEIGYKEFTHEPISSLEKIYAALQLNGFSVALPFIQEELNEYTNYEKNKFELSPESKEEIAKEWKFAFEAFGYKS